MTESEALIKSKEFVKSMEGKSLMTPSEIRYMFSLYDILYHTITTDFNCELCIIRSFAFLKKLTKNI